MSTGCTHLIPASLMNLFRWLLLSSLAFSMPLLAFAADAPFPSEHEDHAHVSSDLVQKVRNATRPFINGPGEGYVQFLDCVTGPDHGAMGIHYVNGGLVMKGVLDPSQPQALIYEPMRDGRLRLVGVEFIVDAATWLSANKGVPPSLDGQTLQFVGSPNRSNSSRLRGWGRAILGGDAAHPG